MYILYLPVTGAHARMTGAQADAITGAKSSAPSWCLWMVPGTVKP